MRIDGAKQVSERSIKKKLLTTQQSWNPFSQKQYFDPDEWKTDLRRIERYYRARGYYQAKVVSSEVTPRGPKEVDVRAQVDEGRPTLIGEVKVTGADDLPRDQKQRLLRPIEKLKAGAIFVEDDWEGVKQQMLHTLADEGYAAGGLEGEVNVGLDTLRADIFVIVMHGPRYRFGPVRAQERPGARVPPRHILEQAEAAMPPSDWYSLEAQSEAEHRVFQMGVFGAVKVRPLQPDPQTLRVPMEVQPQESPFHSIRAGFGIAVDQTRQEARAYGDYTHRDFLGGLRKLTLTATAGYGWIPNFVLPETEGAVGAPVGKVTAELQQPRLLWRDLRANVRLELERGLEPAFSYYGGRAKAGLIWQPAPFLSIYPSYNAEFYRLRGLAQLGTGSAPELLFGCPENCVLSYLEERIEWDERDDQQEPKRGWYLALSLQEGGGFLGGDFDYLRVLPEGRVYYSLLPDDRLTFAARLTVGTLKPLRGETSPIVARFSSGGNDMRGFNARYLSPLVLVPLPGSTTQGYWVPVGGNGLLEGSLEARYTVSGPFIAALFFDTGLVTVEPFDLAHAPGYLGRNLLYAVGAGVRYNTPLGPIRLDFAFRPNLGPALPTAVAPGFSGDAPPTTGCFGLGRGHGTYAPGGGYSGSGGAPEGPCSLQLSIGEAF